MPGTHTCDGERPSKWFAAMLLALEQDGEGTVRQPDKTEGRRFRHSAKHSGVMTSAM